MSPEPGQAQPQKQGNWWQRLPAWAKWTIGVVAAVLLMGIGGAIASNEGKEDDLKDEIALVEKERDQAEGEAESANEDVAAMEDEVSGLTEEAEAEAAKILADAKGEAGDLTSKLGGQRSALKDAEGELAAVEGEIGGAEERAAKSEITDGVWKLETDYVAGTYKAPGGGGCYWALLSEPPSGGLEAIIENGGFNKNQILTIESPYFETNGCGTWELVE
jgi:hypothetical protein